MNDVVQQIKAELLSARRILVTSHIRPDGDAIGSLLGLGLSLQSAGKEVQMVSADGVPSTFRMLAGSEQIHHRPEGVFDYIVVVDCSELNRIGEILDDDRQPDVNIDHHITNQNFARHNLVETAAVATCEILAEILPKAGLPITPTVAAALLTGIITDTLGFRTANMTPQVLRTSAMLMEHGGDLFALYNQTLVQRSYEATRYWGKGLINLEREDGIVWAKLTLADRQAINYPGKDDADLINVLSSISDAKISLVMVEQANNRIKVSWRAQPGYNVAQVAVKFGGGGHAAAAGAEIAGTLQEVCQSVLLETRQALDQIGQTRDKIMSEI